MKRAKKVISDLEEITIRTVKLAGMMVLAMCILLLECWTLIKIWSLIFAGGRM